MCGIVGIVGDSNVSLIDEMNESLGHRGPDGTGTYSFQNLSLGHKRLSILDLTDNGLQPMSSPDEQFVIVFNGEIYNYLQLKADLSQKYEFKSNSDTEVFLCGFVEYGVEIFTKLNGIFAAAIFNRTSGELIVVRDNFGVKPLYYYSDNKTFAFSSELKSLVKIENFDSELDIRCLMDYLTFLWAPSPKTPFLSVKKLLPGHYLKLNIKSHSLIEQIKYYEIPFNGRSSNLSEKDLISILDEKIYKAVERQLISDVPLGFFLSGGLDSSAIVAYAKKINPKLVCNCYTIGTNTDELRSEGFSDDLMYAKIVADHLKVNLKIVPGNMNVVNNFDKMIYHLDEPQGDIAPLHVLNICKQAKEDGISVLLGGAAGDDLFSGYRRHQALSIYKLLDILPNVFWKKFSPLVSSIRSMNPYVRRLKKILSVMALPANERLINSYFWIDPLEVKKLVKKERIVNCGEYNPGEFLKTSLNSIPNEHDLLNQMLFWELKYFLPEHNLNYTDKLSMACGVEVRVPFLDLELVEFSTIIPSNMKLKGKTTKYILKKLMENYLPKEVIYRAKAGFGAPVRTLIATDFSERIDSILERGKFGIHDVFDSRAIRDLRRRNSIGEVDASYSLLVILAIDSWLLQFAK